MTHFATLFSASLAFLAPSESEGDGDPGVVDMPSEPEDDPIVVALMGLPLCGENPTDDEAETQIESRFDDLLPELLVYAIEEGAVRSAYLSNAIAALGVIGASEDLAYLLAASEDISWAYLGDAVDADTSDEDVQMRQGDLAAGIRAGIVSAWSRRGDLPEDALRSALWDTHAQVVARAVQVALQSGDESLVEEALEACDLNDEVAAASVPCPHGDG